MSFQRCSVFFNENTQKVLDTDVAAKELGINKNVTFDEVLAILKEWRLAGTVQVWTVTYFDYEENQMYKATTTVTNKYIFERETEVPKYGSEEL